MQRTEHTTPERPSPGGDVPVRLPIANDVFVFCGLKETLIKLEGLAPAAPGPNP